MHFREIVYHPQLDQIHWVPESRPQSVAKTAQSLVSQPWLDYKRVN